MALTKPTVDSATWGNTNTSSPDMVTPGAGLVNTGFLAYPTKLKRGHLNWLINKLHQGLRYYMSQGIPAWDSSETQYAVGSVVSYLGIAYVLNVASPAGTNPTVDTAHWGLLVSIPPGTLLRETILTSGTSLAKVAGVARARVWMRAAGGPGAGAIGPNTAGGGGSAGSFIFWETTVMPSANWAFAFGAPSAPGSGDGPDSPDTTFSNGVTTVTAKGGKGGKATGDAGIAPGPGLNGTRNGYGPPGGAGVVFNSGTGFFAISGFGGSATDFGGAGGQSITSSTGVANGKDAVGPASGGGGGMANGVGTATGGAATGGMIILQELS